MIALLVLAGCGRDLDPQRAAVLEGFTYGWDFFNHRLSHLEVAPGEASASVAVIGGTSTTSVIPAELPAECDPESCQEFPFADQSLVELRWAVVETTEVALNVGRAELQVGVDGAGTTLEVELPKGADKDATAILAGLTLSTDAPLATGPACYQPIFGWHPREITVDIAKVRVEDGVAKVEVRAAFAAGESLEAERGCVDEVNEQAVVELAVDVLVASARELSFDEAELHAEASYTYGGRSEPDPQPDPDAIDLGLQVPDDAVLGFSTLSFRFHADDPEMRGAYLRTLGWWAAPDGTANAVATNFSPGTQLSGFEYGFDGTVRAIATGGEVRRGTIEATLRTEIEPDGAPVLHQLDY